MTARKSWFTRRPSITAIRGNNSRTEGSHRLRLEALETRCLLSGATSSLTAPIASNDVQPTDGATPLVLDSLSYFSVVDGVALNPATVTITQAPAHGTTSIDPTTGNITYTASAGFAGTDTIGFKVTDDSGLTSGSAYVSEVVSLPIANSASLATEAGQPATLNVLAIDSSVAAALDPAGVAIVGSPAHGTATANATTGKITYTSAANFSGTDSFTYTVADANGVASNPATVTVVVSRPVAGNVSAATPAGTAVVIPVLARDSGPSALAPGSVALVSTPADGTASVNSTTGAITYTPNAGFSGLESFTYTVSDVNGAVSNTGTVSVAVQKPISGNVVNPISTRTEKGVPVAIAVLAVDSATAGLNPASVAVQTAPAHGTASVNSATGAITYNPTSGYTGTDSFAYTVNDENGSPVGTASVSVVVDGPVVSNGLGVIGPGQSVTIPVLASDVDDDNALVPGSVTIVTAPAHGTATVNASTGSVTYTASSSFAGTDSFAYTVANAIGVVSSPATVTVQANGPTASDAFGTTDSGHAISIDVLASASDPAGASALVPGSVHIVSGPSNGTVTVDPTTGSIGYTSITGFNGTDSFTYTVSDANGATSNVGTVSVVVNRPTAIPDKATTPENTPVSIAVSANDSDPDGNQYLVPGSVSLVSGPSNGSVSIGGGSATYSPDYGFVGTDTFTYTIADANGAVSNPGVVTVIVSAGAAANPIEIYLPVQPKAPTPVSSDPTVNYVGGLYRDILGRQADAAGLAAWVGQLQQGVSEVAIARQFLMSTERLDAEVTGYYETFLKRAPDSAGLASMVAGLQAGASEQSIVLGFVDSPEFLAQNSSTGSYLNALYADVLGRAADATGLNSWTAKLNAGTVSRADVAAAFANSTELQQQVVEAYYTAFLGRAADPTGLAVYVGDLAAGKLTPDTLAAAFVGSGEYANDLADAIR